MYILSNFEHREPSVLELAELEPELPLLRAEVDELLAEVALLDRPCRFTMNRWLAARRTVATVRWFTENPQGVADLAVEA